MSVIQESIDTKEKMRVIQLNLNHCEAAQDLLAQTVRERNVDVVLISEPYRISQNGAWISDTSKKSAIWSCGTIAYQNMDTSFTGFVRAELNGVNFYSCYAPPSWTHAEFQNMLDELAADARTRSAVVIAGDFNAWAKEWGSRVTNGRGRSLLETFATLDVELLNDGKVNTFNRAGNGSIIDITFASSTLCRGSKWRVSDHYTQSDHQAVMFEIRHRVNRRRQYSKPTGSKWKDSALDKDMFVEVISSASIAHGPAEYLVSELNKTLVTACDASMPRRTLPKRGQPCYWWNDHIRNLRSQCLRARRRMQRSRGRAEFGGLLQEFKHLRKSLQRAIKDSKKACFKELCDEADSNPWGTAYRIVMKKIDGGRRAQITCPIMLRNIITTLFPYRPAVATEAQGSLADEAIPDITWEELQQASMRIGDSKAPGPDGIPNVALKLAINGRKDIFMETFQKCLKERVFPDRWKIQRLVLIPKGNKSPEEPSSYRPICLLDTMGKILERIIYNRLLPIVEEKGALSEQQFGFRRSRSTTDAVKTVVDIALNAISGERWKGGAKEYCAVVTLDVKNAFNSANWQHIKDALAMMDAPRYIMELITSYFSNRKLIYESDDGTEQYDITAGVPQGSVLGPLLWNIMYDEVLRLPLPPGVRIIGFADDIAVVTVAKHIHEVEAATNMAIMKVQTWLESASLTLAGHKTEAVLITSRKSVEYINVRVGGQVIKSSRSLKYLGVMIDNRLSFKDHIDYVSEKAARIQASLSRILPNIGGPKPARRRLLALVVNSVMLYASPVWAGALAAKGPRRKLTSTHRLSTLRVISGFRTISEDAAQVVAGLIPIDLLASEAQRIYDRKPVNKAQRTEAAREERRNTIATWQARWSASSKGRWTHTLIPNIAVWLERTHGDTNYYLTQFLSGHGCFRKYLHRFGHDSSPMCPNCAEEEEDANHVVFHCPRFSQRGLPISEPQQLVEFMLQCERNWEIVSALVTNILLELRRIERRRAAAYRIV